MQICLIQLRDEAQARHCDDTSNDNAIYQQTVYGVEGHFVDRHSNWARHLSTLWNPTHAAKGALNRLWLLASLENLDAAYYTEHEQRCQSNGQESTVSRWESRECRCPICRLFYSPGSQWSSYRQQYHHIAHHGLKVVQQLWLDAESLGPSRLEGLVAPRQNRQVCHLLSWLAVHEIQGPPHCAR